MQVEVLMRLVFANLPKTETYASAGNMSFLCVAGGGSGGNNYGGGGGAGGLKTSVRRNPTNAAASEYYIFISRNLYNNWVWLRRNKDITV